MDFVPDQAVRQGHHEGGNWSVECVYTPGHTSNHMCLRCVRKKLYLLVTMLWGGRQVSFPPDGDMADHMVASTYFAKECCVLADSWAVH